MSNSPLDQYLELMTTIRCRFETIDEIKSSKLDPFAKAETCAFHGRKIIEGIAFGSLVAVQNGLKQIPREAKGQWNAERILKGLQRKNLNSFPSPSDIRTADQQEKSQYPGVGITIQGVPSRRITRQELISIYSRLHKWLHETNPYVDVDRPDFMLKHENQLWSDLECVQRFIERHTISMAGEMFYATLWDKSDGRTKVLPLSKIASLVPSF